MVRFILSTILTFCCSVTVLLLLCYRSVTALLTFLLCNWPITAKLLLCSCSGVIVLLLLCYNFATTTIIGSTALSPRSLHLTCTQHHQHAVPHTRWIGNIMDTLALKRSRHFLNFSIICQMETKDFVHLHQNKGSFRILLDRSPSILHALENFHWKIA